MDGFDHNNNPVRPRGNKTLVETIEETPEAWSGQGVGRHNANEIDATFEHFSPATACVAGTGSLSDLDFSEFLLEPDPLPEDDIEALAEAALAGQTVLLDEFGNTTLDPPRRSKFLLPITAPAQPEELPQPQVCVYEMLPEDLLLPPTIEPLVPVVAESPEDDIDALLKAYEPPTSRVDLLPETLDDETFEVRWSGRASNGDPVAYFDVFVAVDDGPFEMWQEATSETCASFTGSFGRRYAFFTVATDQAGNRQTLPDGPQAWVRLEGVVVVEEPSALPVVEEEVTYPEPDVIVEMPSAEPVRPRRTAPVLDVALTQPLPAIEMNSFVAEGHRVTDLLGEAVVACEPDHACGVALVAQGGIPNGKWTCSLDQGKTWQPLPPVFHGGALLLGPTDRVRFMPRQMFSGSAGLTFRAWDQSHGKRGQIIPLVKPGTTGGETAFSAHLATCVLPIVAPVAMPVANYRSETQYPLVAGAARGSMVARFPGAAAGAEPRGIAVVSLSGSADGRWQFSRDGGRTWRDFGSVYRGRARLLRAEDRVRFLPRGGYRGPAKLTYHLWDQREHHDTANVLRASAVGEGTPFSAATQSTLWAL